MAFLEDFFAVENNSDFKEYHNYVSGAKLGKINYDISNTFKIKVQNIAIRDLKLKDIFQLRDRFEGQAYMDKLLLKTCALTTVESIISVSLLDLSKITSGKSVSLDLTIGNEIFQIIPFYDGSLPIVSTALKSSIIFCAVRRDYKVGTIYGVLQDYKFDDETLFLSFSNPQKNELKKFIGFNALLPISKILPTPSI